MVAEFLRLRLAVLANGLRHPRATAIAMAVCAAVALALGIALIGAVVSARSATDDIAHAVVVVVGSVVVLGFAVLPLAFGVDDPLDPRRFALIGIRPRILALGLAVASAVTAPAALLVVLVIGTLVVWSTEPLGLLLGLVSLALIIPTCLLLSRLASAFAVTFLAGRRAREATGIILLAVLAAAGPALVAAARLDPQAEGLTLLRRAASVLAWTPLGAPWSIPGDAVLGHGILALDRLLISLDVLVVLAITWELVVRLLVVRQDPRPPTALNRRLGWFSVLGDRPAGAIAARSASYWIRDTRYALALAAVPVAPAVMVVALLIGGVPWSVIAWVPVPVMALFLGWMVHNDLAHDHSAFWVHVSASIPGVADRVGRIVPPLLIGVPLILVGSVVTSAAVGDWVRLPGLIGLGVAALGAGLGVSSVISAAFPYATVHPGDSAFAQPQAAGAGGSVIQASAFLVTVLATAPVVVLVVQGMIAGPVAAAWYWGALVLGLAFGAGAVGLGVRWGGRIVDRTAPELLAFTLRN